MRVGVLRNGDRQLTAVQRHGQWFALDGDDGSTPSTLEALTGAGVRG